MSDSSTRRGAVVALLVGEGVPGDPALASSSPRPGLCENCPPSAVSNELCPVGIFSTAGVEPVEQATLPTSARAIAGQSRFICMSGLRDLECVTSFRSSWILQRSVSVVRATSPFHCKSKTGSVTRVTKIAGYIACTRGLSQACTPICLRIQPFGTGPPMSSFDRRWYPRRSR